MAGQPFQLGYVRIDFIVETLGLHSHYQSLNQTIISSPDFCSPRLPSSMAVAHVEKEHIQRLIEAKKTNISSLESQIQDLTRRWQAEIIDLANLQMMVIPIGKLPTELLATIFQLGITMRQTDPRDIVDKPHRVSQVCRYWRQIAHTTPQLWIDGFSFFVNRHHIDSELNLAQTTAWLERSHPLSITVHFDFIGDRRSIIDFKDTAAFKTLISTAHRWKRVYWGIYFISPMDALEPNSFEALERIDIELEKSEMTEKAIDLFSSCPRLRDVAIRILESSHRQDSGMLKAFDIPWKQLTSLVLKGAITLNECRDILLQCSNLVSVDISADAWDSSSASSSTIVVLPFLRGLNLTLTSVAAPFDLFFASLALPALNSLKLSLMTYDDDDVTTWDVRMFSAFQDRSPNIKEIKLDSGRYYTENLIALLRHSPTITQFSLYSSIDDTFLRALEYKEVDVQPLAPFLKELILEGIGREPLDDTLETVIRSRWRSESIFDIAVPRTASLERVVVSRGLSGNNDSFGQEMRTRLQVLREQGLDLLLC